MIYLDNAATTFPKPAVVYDAMDKQNREGAINAGRGSYKLAQEASRLIAETKNQIRNLVHTDSTTAVIFTPSVTIAMNQIINGISIRENAVLYVSPYEHNAVARTINELAKKKSVRIKEIPINLESYEIDLERMKYEFIKDKPNVVFCTHVSNVTGYVLPVEEIFYEAKRYDSVTVLDSAQSLGLVSVRADLLNADIIAFAGHKTLYGPFGIGGFINVGSIPLDIFITGGTGSDSLNLEMPDGKESKYESSSTNIVAVAGLNAALSVLTQEDIMKKEIQLTRYLIDKLQNVKGIRMYIPSSKDNHVGIISITVDGISSEDIGTILDEDFDIAVRAGYHCAPYIHKYLKSEKSHGTVRIGLGRFSTLEDIDRLVSALKEIVDE